MIIDAFCLILLLFAAWKGWSSGFFSSLVSFTGMFIGFFIAMKCSASVAVYLKEEQYTNSRWASFIAFGLVLLGVSLMLTVVAKAISKVAEAIMLGWLNKTGGLILSVVLYSMMISGFFFFGEKLSFFTKETIDNSFLYPIIKPIAPKLLNMVGKWVPFFEKTFSELNRSFG
ncbi:MAG: CvpA family protein [Bacteroidota bacterium]